MDGEDSSSDLEEIPHRNHGYSSVEVEPHYAPAVRRAKEGGDDASENSNDDEGEEGVGRRRESLSRSVSQNSVHSDARESTKDRRSDDDDDDDARQRHDVRDDAYEHFEELDAYDKVIDQLDDNYYGKAAERKADESDREDREDKKDSEDREDRSGSRNSEARDDVRYEEIPADREQKSESGSEQGNEEDHRQYENNNEELYSELDIRQEDDEAEREQERRDSQSSDSDGVYDNSLCLSLLTENSRA